MAFQSEGEEGLARIRLLGCFEVRIGPQLVPLPRACAELLSFLVLAGGASERSVVAGSLWSDKTETRASANLRSALWRLPNRGQDIVDTSGRRLALTDGVVADVRILEYRARQLIGGDAPGSSEDLEQLDGELLPGWDQPWVVLERERLRHLRLYALETLSRQFLEIGRVAEAVLGAVAAVQGEPLRESANRALIAAHLADGNRWEAVRQYHQYRELLWDELGVTPSRDLTDMLGDAIAL